jgi:hypothetical protein
MFKGRIREVFKWGGIVIAEEVVRTQLPHYLTYALLAVMAYATWELLDWRPVRTWAQRAYSNLPVRSRMHSYLIVFAVGGALLCSYWLIINAGLGFLPKVGDKSSTDATNQSAKSAVAGPSTQSASEEQIYLGKLQNLKRRTQTLSGQIFEFLKGWDRNEPPRSTAEMAEAWAEKDDAAFSKAFVEAGEKSSRYSNEMSGKFSKLFGARLKTIRDDLSNEGFDSLELDKRIEDTPRLKTDIQSIAEELQKLADQINVPQNATADEGPSLAPEGLIINDVIRTVYPDMTLDFRISNPSTREISISRLFLMILSVETGDSPVGKQEISDTATIGLTTRLREGDVLQAPLALDVKGPANDRFTAKFYWADQPQSVGYWYTALPAIQTSSGFVQGPLVRIHMQQTVWGGTARSRVTGSPSWDVPEDAVNPVVDWNVAVKHALPFETRKIMSKPTH